MNRCMCLLLGVQRGFVPSYMGWLCSGECHGHLCMYEGVNGAREGARTVRILERKLSSLCHFWTESAIERVR